VLIALALLATSWPFIALGLAIAVVIALLVWLMRQPDTAPEASAVQT
jgi:hypothetical protein